MCLLKKCTHLLYLARFSITNHKLVIPIKKVASATPLDKRGAAKPLYLNTIHSLFYIVNQDQLSAESGNM